MARNFASGVKFGADFAGGGFLAVICCVCNTVWSEFGMDQEVFKVFVPPVAKNNSV